MAKPELGLKRVCVACGTKFYDLMRAPAICPKCGTEQPAEQPKLKRAPAPPDDRVKKRAAPAEADADDIVEVDAEEGDEAIEDAEELEDADETLGDEIEVESDREEET
ncbi:TIGR02300 family protein [Falsiroseomonas bella]|uniref:TIGR02300 family protein n=1 Tax=Falsiroseomonas bella TaxID=2184016 RepID=A0A317FN67_9PROT|nr:TIGR02300 family protein [Falsiroseomonas bella]PWS38908.1 TIGR02300 family protein [Falsiroseomonas bella]